MVFRVAQQLMENMFFLFVLSIALSGVSYSKASIESIVSFNVIDYGAVGDGETDNSQNFLEAWMNACHCEIGDARTQVIVPEGLTFLVTPVVFKGPCNVKNINFLENMFFLFVLSMALSGVSYSKASIESIVSFNVIDYGAVGDGETDNSQNFLEAWMNACHCEIGDARTQVIVPEGLTFLVTPVVFKGPCNVKNINFLVYGTIIAPDSPIVWEGQDASEWLVFESVSGLLVDGLGTIDARGQSWWDQSCNRNPGLDGCTTLAPTALKFVSCNDSSLRNLFITNSPQTHVLLHYSNGFEIDYVTIQSPDNSPNTDGIHIQASHRLAITNSRIGSGDDCISVGDYVSYLDMVNIYCGPGHGISIGSLGRSGNNVEVENIRVINAMLNGTTNGARIKTWQVGKGHVRGVTFENMVFSSVKYPIIIDQNYCDVRGECPELDSGVQISEVVYRGLFGTSLTDAAIVLNCSRFVPCYGILMQSIQLFPAMTDRPATAECSNAYGEEIGVEPGPCLTQISDRAEGSAASPKIAKESSSPGEQEKERR